MGNGGNRSNPTALRSGGGGRIAGQRTVAGMARLRNQRRPGLQGALDQARSNARRAARRVAGR